MIGELINKQLRSYTPLTDIIGTNVFPLVAPMETELPHIIYEVIGLDPDYSRDGVHDGRGLVDNFLVLIRSYSLKYKELQEISLQVRFALEGKTISTSTMTTRSILFSGYHENFDAKTENYSSTIQIDIAIDLKGT